MKRTVSIVVLAACALFAALALFSTNMRNRALTADGGAPMPPWPKTGNTLLADGGAPMPPWPKTGNTLLADGGAPMPPWPKKAIFC